MSYTKTFSQLSPSEWKKVEQFIDMDYELYATIADSMWFDMTDYISNTYNGKGNKCFKCYTLNFDGENLTRFNSFKLDLNYIDYANRYDGGIEYYYNNEREYDYHMGDNTFNLVDITVTLVPDVDVNYHDIKDCIHFRVKMTIVKPDGTTVKKEDFCTFEEFEVRFERFMEQYGLTDNYLDIVSMMDGARYIIIKKFEQFKEEVVDVYSKWFAMRGPEFRNYMLSYPDDCGVIFNDNGNIEEIVL